MKSRCIIKRFTKATRSSV